MLNGAPMVEVEGEIASDGAVLWPSSLPQTLNWNGDGTINYIQVVLPPTPGTGFAGGTYRQTFSYTAGQLTGISVWTKQ